MPNDRKRPLGAVSVAMAGVPAGVGLAHKRRQFRKPLPVGCIIRIAGARAGSSPAVLEDETAIRLSLSDDGQTGSHALRIGPVTGC
jgi:hypothetical protein